MTTSDRCPNCNARVQARDRFCHTCGHSLPDAPVRNQHDQPSISTRPSWDELWGYGRERWRRKDWKEWQSRRERSEAWLGTHRTVAIFLGIAIIVIVIAAIAGESERTADSDVDGISGLPYCKKADFWVLAGGSGVSIQNNDETCALALVAITLNDKYECGAFLAVSGKPLSKPISACVDQNSGERFNPSTTAVVDCKVNVQRPRVRGRRCFG